jgi:hypothetical protein
MLSLVLEDGRRWGEAAEPWQRADAEAILDQSGARLHYLTRPRGASKTTDLAAVAIAALVTQLSPRSRSYAAAADRDQAALLLDALAGFRARTEGLAGAVRVDAWRATATRTGATLEVLAADEASSWGLRPRLLVLDEFARWPTTVGARRFWTSLFSALPKLPDSRLAILTTAGAPSHPAHKLLQRARATPERWRVSEVPGATPWLHPADLDEQRAELPAWEFERLHLNRWTESEDRLTSVADLAACVTLDGPRDWQPGRRYAMSLDLGLKADRTVLAVCSAESGSVPTIALDRMLSWQGSRCGPSRSMRSRRRSSRRGRRTGVRRSSLIRGRRRSCASACGRAACASRSTRSARSRCRDWRSGCTGRSTTGRSPCRTTRSCSTNWRTCACARRVRACTGSTTTRAATTTGRWPPVSSSPAPQLHPLLRTPPTTSARPVPASSGSSTYLAPNGCPGRRRPARHQSPRRSTEQSDYTGRVCAFFVVADRAGGDRPCAVGGPGAGWWS